MRSGRKLRSGVRRIGRNRNARFEYFCISRKRWRRRGLWRSARSANPPDIQTTVIRHVFRLFRLMRERRRWRRIQPERFAERSRRRSGRRMPYSRDNGKSQPRYRSDEFGKQAELHVPRPSRIQQLNRSRSGLRLRRRMSVHRLCVNTHGDNDPELYLRNGRNWRRRRTIPGFVRSWRVFDAYPGNWCQCLQLRQLR